ncbi:MAG: Cro/CI family transcriptional regulator [Pseudomonadales bacterium]
MKLTEAMPLNEFVQGRKQDQIAAALGVTQGSVSQMMNSSRSIWVRALPDGGYQAYEVRPIGRKPAQQIAA